MATNKSLKRDIKIAVENRIINEEEVVLNKEQNLFNNEGEAIITSFNILETVKSEDNAEKEPIKDIINEQSEVKEESFKQDEIKDRANALIKDEDFINEEEDNTMNFKIFKRYMELCNNTGLIPSWIELNKFKEYYMG